MQLAARQATTERSSLAGPEETTVSQEDEELIQQARHAFTRDYGYLEKVLKEASRTIARQNRPTEDE